MKDDPLKTARAGFEESVAETLLDDALAGGDAEDRRFGDYELVERVGRGGMGVVFRARQISLGRDVALKFIVGVDDAAAVARFLDEARAAARLHHPNIVSVYETGVVEGMNYFSMPLLHGATLADRLAGARPTHGEAVTLMTAIGTAVDYAHNLGLLHLDLKPANVLLDARGEPSIADFGLARRIDEAGGVDAVDASGTPGYMAPEQVRGGRLDRRTDVYALGAMLAALLHGDPRDAGARADADLDAICRHCLEADPARRYASAADFVADLARWRDGNAVSVRMPAWRERFARVVRRHPGAAFASTMAAAALVAGLMATTWQWRRAESARAEADRQQAYAVIQAQRVRQLAELTAAAFPSGTAAQEEQATSARHAVAWLKRNLGGDPAAQRALLTAFREALVAAGKGDAVSALLDEIVDQLGAGYRESIVARLAAAGDRDSLIAAALVGIPRGADGVSGSAHEAVLQRLHDAFGGDVLALYAAALACHAQPLPCAHPEYRERLVERFPDNAVHWVIVPKGIKRDDEAIAADVARAASVAGFDERVGAIAAILRAALRDAEPPPSIAEPMRAVVDESDVAPSLRRHAIDAVPLPGYGDIVRVCRPDGAVFRRTATLRDACDAFAQRAMRSPQSSILARMVGSAILRRLHPGTPVAAEAKEYRRLYVWLSEQARLAPKDPEALQADVIAYGEWEAWQRQAERAGASRTPPAGWMPADPNVLLLPEERAR